MSSSRLLRPAVLSLAVVVLVGSVVVARSVRMNPERPDRPVLVGTGDWFPYTDADDPNGGPLVEMVEEILLMSGLRPTTRFESWAAVEARVERGQVFAAFPFVASADRRASLRMSDPVLEFQYVTFVNTATVTVPAGGGAELGALSLGLVRGYDYWPELDDHRDPATTVVFDDASSAFDALVRGEVDAVPEGIDQGVALLDSMTEVDTSHIRALDRSRHPALTSEQTLHILFPASTSNEDVARVDEAISSFRATEEYRELRADAVASHIDRGVLEVDPGPVEVVTGDGQTMVTPNGTSVTVLDWFASGDDPLASSSGVEVKVLDGPLRGRVVTVTMGAIRLEDE